MERARTSGAPRRRRPWLALAGGAVAAALGALAAAAPPAVQQVTVTVAAPTFWTCAPPPALPAVVPQNAAGTLTRQQQRCGENAISGMHLNAIYSGPGGPVPAGTVALSLIETKGRVGRTTGASTACGDQQRTFLFLVPIHLRTPAVQFDLTPLCCEWTFVGDTESWVMFAPLPPGAQPIPPGENAALAGTTPAQLDAVTAQIEGGVTAIWRYDYAYDGCRPTAPATFCSRAHCVTVEVFDATPTPPAGVDTILVGATSYLFDE